MLYGAKSAKQYAEVAAIFYKQFDSLTKDKRMIMFYRKLMIGGNLPNLSFQTFFVSREQSNSPLVSEMMRIGKNFKEQGLLKDVTGIISSGYGKRMIIPGNDFKLDELKRGDFLEIIDYNPVKKIVLAIGRNQPCIETPVHWLIHHARDDANAIIQLNGENVIKKLSKKFPVTEKECPPGTLDLAKEILKLLRTNKNIIIKDTGALFVGANIKEVENSVLKALGEPQ